MAALVALSISLSVVPARASKLPIDLDSLVFSSDQIVEGRIMPPDQYDGWAVEVTHVLSGSFRVAQRIHPGNLLQHEVPGTGCFAKNREPLAAGELVVLFMRDEPKLECVYAGMFLLVHGNVCRFGIEEPMDTMGWQPPLLTPDSPTFRELADGVAERLPLAAQWRAMINAPLDSKNVHNLLELTHRWAKPPQEFYLPGEPFDGAILAAIADRLATLNDPAIAYQAIDSASFAFSKIFQTRRGRDFLLDKIIDPKLAIPRRFQLIRILEDAGSVYSSNMAQAATQPWSSGTAPDPSNSFYLTRIARAAQVAAAQDEQVSLCILSALEQMTSRGWSSEKPDPEIQADLDRAADVLRMFYKAPGVSGNIQFAIERVLAGIDYNAYLSLHSACGPIPTVVRPSDPTQYAPPPVPSVSFEYESDCVLPMAGGRLPPTPTVTSADLVLTSVDGGAGYSLPAKEIDLRPFISQWGVFVRLPAGFRRGIYEVHVRLMNGRTAVSEGHGFQTLLPQAVRPWPRPSAGSVVSFWLAGWWNKWSGRVEAALALVVSLLMLRRWMWSRRRVARFRGGRCHVCGYDVRASSGKCSECGTVIADSLRIHVLRRRLIRLVCLGAVTTCAGLIVLYARSYYAGDLITRTDFFRADTVYVTRGIAAIQWLTVGNDLGWIHLTENPADLPRSPDAAGPPAERRLLGLEYSRAANSLFLPLWMPLVATLLLGLILFPLGRPVSISRDGSVAGKRLPSELRARMLDATVRLKKILMPNQTA